MKARITTGVLRAHRVPALGHFGSVRLSRWGADGRLTVRWIPKAWIAPRRRAAGL